MSILNRKVTVSFDLLATAKMVIFIIIALFFVRLLGQLSSTLALIVTAAFLAIALNPAVSKIVKALPSKNRTLATGVAFLAVVTFLGGFFIITIPPIAEQVSKFSQDLPETISTFKEQDNFLSNLVRRYDLDNNISQGADAIIIRLTGTDNSVIGTVNKLTNAVIGIVAVLIMTFMMLIEGPRWIEEFWSFTDSKKLKPRKKLAKQMNEVITGYVNGQLLITTIAASVSLIAMVILNVPNALAMAGIVGLFGLIPLIGTTLAAAIVVLATLLVSVKLAIVMAVFFLIYQQIENATIQPYIQGRKSDLTALTVFIAALVGINIAGLFGAFLAIPAAGCLKVILDDYLIRSGKRPVI